MIKNFILSNADDKGRNKMEKPLNYSFKAPYSVVGIVNQILGLDHKTDSREEDKQEYRNKPKKRRDDE